MRRRIEVLIGGKKFSRLKVWKALPIEIIIKKSPSYWFKFYICGMLTSFYSLDSFFSSLPLPYQFLLFATGDTEGMASPTYYCCGNTQVPKEKSWNENKVLQYSNTEFTEFKIHAVSLWLKRYND